LQLLLVGLDEMQVVTDTAQKSRNGHPGSSEDKKRLQERF
jgi:hypothetical protein